MSDFRQHGAVPFLTLTTNASTHADPDTSHPGQNGHGPAGRTRFGRDAPAAGRG